jgi:transposase
MKDSGMSTASIAKDLGFSNSTVRNWFTKERPEAIAAAQPPAPAPAPAPKPEPEPEPVPELDAHGFPYRAPSNELSPTTKAVMKKEKEVEATRIAQLSSLVELKTDLREFSVFLSKHVRKYSIPFVRRRVKKADELMVENGFLVNRCTVLGIKPTSSYKEAIWAIAKAAKEVSTSCLTMLHNGGYYLASPQWDDELMAVDEDGLADNTHRATRDIEVILRDTITALGKDKALELAGLITAKLAPI